MSRRFAFSALTLLVGRQEGHPACKKTEWWGAGVVVCLEQGADLHMARLMPLPLAISCFSKIQIVFTFLVLAHLGSPGQRAVKCLCVSSVPTRTAYVSALLIECWPGTLVFITVCSICPCQSTLQSKRLSTGRTESIPQLSSIDLQWNVS